MDLIYRLLVPLSLLGLFLCAVWHIAALVGHQAASMDRGAMSMPLFVGIFLVWLPTIWRLRHDSCRQRLRGRDCAAGLVGQKVTEHAGRAQPRI